MVQSIKQYDVVRVIDIRGKGAQGLFGSRSPRVGDVACVVEVYTHPRDGYELECVSSAGETEWLASFAVEDVTLEYIKSNLRCRQMKSFR